MNDFDWISRIEAAWTDAPAGAPDELVRTIDALAAERAADDAVALFERACARDTAGREAEAEPLYRAAVAGGQLYEYRRARATIQLGSTLRALGRLDESERFLTAELDRHAEPANPTTLHEEALAILALTYLAQARAGEAAGLLLHALGPRLSRYRRTIATHAAKWAPRS
ncbi:MAG TPA: tetratricopeptide repeat protein [Rhodanobacteraceae bacterium]|nr:tetratricopeptide repeat protein [Rhodanobacteraceae bacterium]